MDGATVPRMDPRLLHAFGVAQRLLITAVGVALIALSAMALWDTVVLVYRGLVANQLTYAVTVGIDTVFLTVILLELLHTVVGLGPIVTQIEEFIVIGITSAIRHGLSIVASSSVAARVGTHTGTVPATPRDTVISLAINSASVLLLVAAFWLIRTRREAAD